MNFVCLLLFDLLPIAAISEGMMRGMMTDLSMLRNSFPTYPTYIASLQQGRWCTKQSFKEATSACDCVVIIILSYIMILYYSSA